MLSPGQMNSGGARWPLVWYALATLLAVFTYFYGLGSDHIPKNGDEFPYASIYFSFSLIAFLA